MPSADRRRTVLEAQSHLHRWNLDAVRERADRFREARADGVTPDQIAMITGAPVEDVLTLLGEPLAPRLPAVVGWA